MHFVTLCQIVRRVNEFWFPFRSDFSFVHEGHKIKLAPLSPKEASEDQAKLGKKIEDERKEAKEKKKKQKTEKWERKKRVKKRQQ